MKKNKVVWICHFTSSEVQTKLPLWRKKNEFASWIPNMLKGFENSDDIELHIISPHEYLKKQTSYSKNNIHYHFVPYGMPIIHRHWPWIFRYDIYSSFSSFRKKVKKIVEKLKPDLINLIGAENAYYSSSIFDFQKDYPILITIQGFISQLKGESKLLLARRKKIAVEEKILSNFKYFCGENDSSKYISVYNPDHKFFKVFFPVNELLVDQTKANEKKYDCVYFGTLSKIKGTEDFIKVITEIKKVRPDIKACIIGGGNSEPFLKLSEDLGCSDNIEFTGFLETQKELFEKVKSAKVFLAPPFLERLSSTIREAMYLKVPIVAYATGGIPYINEFDENVLLVKTGDYKAMAEKTSYLLQNDKEREALAEKAYNYAQNEYSIKTNTERLINAYHKILEEKNEL